jgi:hypothetical protein
MLTSPIETLETAPAIPLGPSQRERLLAIVLNDSAGKTIAADILKEVRAQVPLFENRELSFRSTCERRGAVEFDNYKSAHPAGSKTKLEIDREIEFKKDEEKNDLRLQTQSCFALKKKFCGRMADHIHELAESAAATHKREDAKWDQPYSERQYVRVMRETVGWLRGIRLARDIQHPREMFAGFLDL